MPPEGDENCAECPHDCRKVILQPRNGLNRAVNAENTHATAQKVLFSGPFATSNSVAAYPFGWSDAPSCRAIKATTSRDQPCAVILCKVASAARSARSASSAFCTPARPASLLSGAKSATGAEGAARPGAASGEPETGMIESAEKGAPPGK